MTIARRNEADSDNDDASLTDAAALAQATARFQTSTVCLLQKRP